MLEVQKYLENHTIEDLSKEFHIDVTKHATKPLMILNYSEREIKTLEMFRKVRSSQVARECRALVLNSNDYSLVAKSFTRFFNYNEHPEETSQFVWQDCLASDKHDGSLCSIFHYDGEWHIITRGSFGNCRLRNKSATWKAGILRGLGINYINELDQFIDRRINYVGEFVSPWNKVVKSYPEPKVHLLAAFEGENEISVEELLRIKAEIFVPPVFSNMWSYEEVALHIRKAVSQDPTYEGMILRDKNNFRLKVKSEEYIKLHNRLNQSTTISDSSLIELLLTQADKEFLVYFPEYEGKYYKMKTALGELYAESLEEWMKYNHIKTKKEFYLMVKDLPVASLLASYYDQRTRNPTVNFREVFMSQKHYLNRFLISLI